MIAFTSCLEIIGESKKQVAPIEVEERLREDMRQADISAVKCVSCQDSEVKGSEEEMKQDIEYENQ